MKSAEEWQTDIGFQCDFSGEDRPDEPLVSVDTIKQIQLDAWKQGMKSAADLVMIDYHSPGIASSLDYVAEHVSRIEEIES